MVVVGSVEKSARSCASVSRIRLVMSVVRRRAFVKGRAEEKLERSGGEVSDEWKRLEGGVC